MVMNSHSSRDVDVLVVGYGPVGATLACLLGQYGVRALVIDKSPDVYAAPRAIALDNEALRVLQMAGLDESSFERVVIPFVRMRCPYVGEFSRVNTQGTIDGHPKLVTFFQPDLERALRAKVAEHATVQTLLGVELRSFVDEGSNVDACLLLADGGAVNVRAKYLVGADGASSFVRRAIGQEFDGQTYPEDWLIVDARQVPHPIDHVEFLCDPHRAVPHMVAPGGRERWEFMLRPGEKPEDMERLDAIRELLKPWGAPEQMQIERKAVYRFHARCCDAFSKGRVFLAGDAAHVTPPFVGQGLVAGLRDAANLSWKLAAVTRGRAAPAILSSYDEERRPHAKAMIGLAKLMGHLVMPKNAFAAVLNHGFVRTLRLLPPLRHFLDDLGIKPKNRFRRGLFVPGGGPLVRGGQLPQALVRGTNGAARLSDAVLGAGLTLLGFGVPPSHGLSAGALRAWTAAGGTVARICRRGEPLHGLDDAFEDLDDVLVPAVVPVGWLAVVRPDQVVLHQGPVAEADRVVRESLALMGA
jgi:3-(3-hydroxy-phenyl)propionate hydroxylase